MNNVPAVTSISGPTASDNLAPVNFQGAGSDADGQALTFRWVLVARPSGSAATLPPGNVSSVTLSPDVAGLYADSRPVMDLVEFIKVDSARAIVQPRGTREA